MDPATIRGKLLAWYRRSRRPLPWRGTRDPYRIWISEVMLQQTRVAAVLPYYERFLARFPDVAALASAPEPELLAAWSGLGYYSRARNLQRAARQIVARGGFPRDYDSIRALPGVGAYTAAAIASIAFGLPRAVLDGNVARVLARLANDHGDIRSGAVRRRLEESARALLDARRPGDFNQALMELGATVCLPRAPRCESCPLNAHCLARQENTAGRLPVSSGRAPAIREERALAVVRGPRGLLLRQRGAGEARLAGFWELPEASELGNPALTRKLGEFRHSIVNRNYAISVWEATLRRAPRGFRWVAERELERLPLSTAARKALRLAILPV